MRRFALLCSILTLTAACGDGRGAPTANRDGLSLIQEGDPPPPPLDGGGFVSFSPGGGGGDEIGATESVTPDDCVPPEFAFDIEGDYFRNKTENLARITFRPGLTFGSGHGTIQETARDAGDARASGTLVVIGSDLQQHQIHLLDYTGISLFLTGESFGSIGLADLVAEVEVCGERTGYTGKINFNWVCDDECGKEPPT